MTSEARPRQRPIVNPEHLHQALRDIVNAWLRPSVDLRRDADLTAVITHAQRLLGMDKRDITPLGSLNQ